MINLIPDFISPEEEKEILSHIPTSKVTLGTSRNRIIRYGSTLPYKAPVMGPIPTYLLPICQRLFDQKLLPYLPDSITINEYHKGQGIDWHIDSPSSGPIITVLSLLGSATMVMRLREEKGIYNLFPRSLIQIDGQERTEWEHSILPVNMARFSIVFRKGTK